jgi:prepilin-type N-terminal cleavage/methylation domain-containing protein
MDPQWQGENMRSKRISRAFRPPPHGRKAFTLIELLVVIAIVALLMAILLPTLGRVRKQARAVACQANLRQWGMIWATYTTENDGHLPGWGRDPQVEANEDSWLEGWGSWPNRPGRAESSMMDIRCCPMATKQADPTGQGAPWGGTFLAWGGGPSARSSEPVYASYGLNGWMTWWNWHDYETARRRGWSTTDVKEAASVPVLLDSCWPWTAVCDATSPPPESDGIPTRPGLGFFEPFCINRHDGCINALFLDWSVRKVGLKELWTLKWHREYDTAGPWTKAGGVTADQWPKWMQRFKDY